MRTLYYSADTLVFTSSSEIPGKAADGGATSLWSSVQCAMYIHTYIEQCTNSIYLAISSVSKKICLNNYKHLLLSLEKFILRINGVIFVQSAAHLFKSHRDYCFVKE